MSTPSSAHRLRNQKSSGVRSASGRPRSSCPTRSYPAMISGNSSFISMHAFMPADRQHVELCHFSKRGLTFDDGFFVELAYSGPDHACPPEVLALLALLEFFNLIRHVIQHVEKVRIPVFLACTSIWGVES